MGWGEVTCVSETRGWKALGQPWVQVQRDHSCWQCGQRAVSGPRPGPPPGSTWARSAPPSRWEPGWRWGARWAPRREGGAGERAGLGRAGCESERGGGGWEVPALPHPLSGAWGTPRPGMAERTPGPGPGQRVGFHVSPVPAPVRESGGQALSAAPSRPTQVRAAPAPALGLAFYFRTPRGTGRPCLPVCLSA